MRIGIDFDNVIADYNGAMKKLVEEIRGLKPGSLPESNSWGFENWDLPENEFILYHRLLCETDRNLSMKMVAGAGPSINLLRFAGHEIVILTQRANWKHFNSLTRVKVIQETVQWLENNNISFDDLCFVNDKTTVDVDILIDDGPHHIEAYQKLGKDIIIFDYPCNRHFKGLRVKTWVEVEKVLGILKNKESLIQLLEHKKEQN